MKLRSHVGCEPALAQAIFQVFFRCDHWRSMFYQSVIRYGLKPSVNLITQRATFIIPTKGRKTIPVYEPLATAHKDRKLMELIEESLYAKYDPSGWRRELISKENKEGLRSGDIIRVNYQNDPNNALGFVGYILAIDRNGPDSTILLRNKITKVGVELRVSLFNPIIERIDIIRKPHKYNGRLRHYYIRDTKLDVGDLETLIKKKRK